MTREQTLRLFNKGDGDWNRWAQERINQQKLLAEHGQWIQGDEELWNKETRDWHRDSAADFSNYQFDRDVSFSRLTFPASVNFESSKFQKSVRFIGTSFGGDVNFSNTEFSGPCLFKDARFVKSSTFQNAEFQTNVGFTDSHFAGSVEFKYVKFKGFLSIADSYFQSDVAFTQAELSDISLINRVQFCKTCWYIDIVCKGTVLFSSVKFEHDAFFDGSAFDTAPTLVNVEFRKIAQFMRLKGKGLFCYNVTFARVPDFSAAHFEEAPHFDRIVLPDTDSKKQLDRATRLALPSHWRALRRLAVQAHDYERELQFFKYEIIARRGTQDRWNGLRFWVGIFYQGFSDFGRSMSRPILAWIASAIVFSAIYACQSPTVIEWPLTAWSDCMVGDGDARVAAVRLSLYNGIPFARVRSGEQIERSYECLYGVQHPTRSASSLAATDDQSGIPILVELFGTTQIILSTIIVFLLGLTIRNNFRIK